MHGCGPVSRAPSFQPRCYSKIGPAMRRISVVRVNGCKEEFITVPLPFSVGKLPIVLHMLARGSSCFALSLGGGLSRTSKRRTPAERMRNQTLRCVREVHVNRYIGRFADPCHRCLPCPSSTVTVGGVHSGIPWMAQIDTVVSR